MPTVRAARPLAQDMRVDLEQCLGAQGSSASSEPSTKRPMCKYVCLGISSVLIFIVVVTDELI